MIKEIYRSEEEDKRLQSDEWKGENNPIREGRREGAEEVSENIFFKITIRSAKRFFFFFYRGGEENHQCGVCVLID